MVVNRSRRSQGKHIPMWRANPVSKAVPYHPLSDCAPLPPSSSQRKSGTLSMRQRRSGPGITPSHIPRRPGSPAPVFLVATGIQSPFHVPKTLWPRHYSIPYSTQIRWSRSRLSRRNGNPEPFLCAKDALAPALLHPIFPADPVAQPPPFSSQRESRALSMHQRRSGAGITPSHIPRRPGSPAPVFTMKIGHFHPHVWPWRGHGNSRHNGNPEPFWCVCVPKPLSCRNSPIPYPPRTP